jgi:alpha-galactosidase
VSTINFVLIIALVALGHASLAAESAQVAAKNIRIEFDKSMHSRVVALFSGQEKIIGDFAPSEFVRMQDKDTTEFSLQSQRREAVRDRLGPGSRTVLTGTTASLRKTVAVTVYEAFPRIVFFDVSYTNTGSSDLTVTGWTNQHYGISAGPSPGGPAFWSYQSGSYEKRPDWVLPLAPGFKQENFLGMNASDYGGGTPVVDVWRRDVGVAVGHVEMAPKLVSLPVAMEGADRATVAV